MKIVFIGSGNVATHLSKELKKAGHTILQVYSRTASHAKKLSHNLNTGFTDDLASVRKDADIYIIAVKDEALTDLSKKIILNDKLVVHTSGSVEMDVLKKISANYGVFYPMQTFTKKASVDFSEVPIFIEANNAVNEKLLLRIASGLTYQKKIHLLDSDQRKKIHLAAVFVNNFTNHLYAIGEQILKDEKLPFEILKPLILETARKVQFDLPSKVQTGPAKRGDKKIISEHLKMLNTYPMYKKIYKIMTSGITGK